MKLKPYCSRSFLVLPVYTSHLLAATVEDDHIAGAKKEGALVLYLSTNLADANGLVQLYKSKYPFVKVDMFRADNEKLLNRILTESVANKFNGDAIMISSFEVRVLLQKKLLQRYVSPHAKYYPEGFTDKEGYWTSVYSIPRVIAYNTNLAKPVQRSSQRKSHASATFPGPATRLIRDPTSRRYAKGCASLVMSRVKTSRLNIAALRESWTGFRASCKSSCNSKWMSLSLQYLEQSAPPSKRPRRSPLSWSPAWIQSQPGWSIAWRIRVEISPEFPRSAKT